MTGVCSAGEDVGNGGVVPAVAAAFVPEVFMTLS